jgi:hypothetical protein
VLSLLVVGVIVFSFVTSGWPQSLPPALDIPVYRQILPRAAVELRRARRYEQPLCVVLLSPHGFLVEGAQADMFPRSVPLLYALLGSFLRNSLRETDLLAAVPEDLSYALFLPQTGEVEAQAAIHRLDGAFHRMATTRLHHGIAVFPRNGLTLEDLFMVARRSWHPSVSELLNPTLTHEASHG